jgi:predicted transposase/invertase (TIGR01784 family)
MNDFKEKYINPFTDYGFKRLFGEEPNKDLLLDFLNELLKEEQGTITELSYLPNEKLPISFGDRRAIFDIYCTNEKGEQFIVEIQKAEQKFFKDRTIFYSTFPIQEQARNKDRFWDFELKAVYTIGILDFVFEESDKNKFRHDVKLTEQNDKKVFYDKLTYIYLEMPKFQKTETELATRFDKWMFILKNLPKLDRIPVELKEKIFLQLFETAEIAKLKPDEYKQYEASVNAYRDIFNIKNTYLEKGKMEGKIEGKIEGKLEGKLEVAKKMKNKGIELSIIMEMTGLTEQEIEELNNQ